MKVFSLFLIIFMVAGSLMGQSVGISSTERDPDASAILDIHSTDKGLLIPRMTAAERGSISNPAIGLLVYQTTAPAGFYYYTGDDWLALGTGEGVSGQVIDVDGNVYTTVQIGDQVWMAQNLKVQHYRDGTPIGIVSETADWSNADTGAMTWYDNDPDNAAVYGALYNWFAVDNHTANPGQELCPVGYRMPDASEWSDLNNYLVEVFNNNPTPAILLKTALYWQDEHPGHNHFGFSAIPAGYRLDDGIFDLIGAWAFFWSADGNNENATARSLTNISFSEATDHNKKRGYSVRCIRK